MKGDKLELINERYIYISFFKMVHLMLGKRDFLSSSPMIKWFGKHYCSKPINQRFCADLLFLLCGFDWSGLNQVREKITK